MKMSFRWYGDSDPVTLQKIRQIPAMHGIVSAVYDIPVGEAWPLARIEELKKKIEAYGLKFEVIESVPVHEEIKLGLPSRDRMIDNYCVTLRRLAQCGLKVVCYNFLAVFDWVRTSLETPLPDGSTTLSFKREELDKIDIDKGFSLPGWDASFKPEELRVTLERYRDFTEQDLFANLAYFLKKVVPVAAEVGIRMAIHTDDPPFTIFGLPRIVKNREDLHKILAIIDSPANGLTLCTGSLASEPQNDVPAIVREMSGLDRVPFIHLRNVKTAKQGDFYESGHLSAEGSVDMGAVIKALYDTGFTGYARPDHGRMIWGEVGRPGYGLYDRALGATYLNGIWEGVAAACKR